MLTLRRLGRAPRLDASELRIDVSGVSISLTSVVRALETIAPLELAEPWDNVGLLIDPRAGADADIEVTRALLTIDLTLAVFEEARSSQVQCIVAYHPPIFSAVKRVSRQEHAVLFEAVAAKIAVYSPHTALDAAPAGLSDWLAKALGPGRIQPLRQHAALDQEAELKLVTFVPSEAVDRLRDALATAGAGEIGNYSRCSFNLQGEGTFFGNQGSQPRVGEPGRLERAQETRLEMVCSKSAVPELAAVLRRVHPYEEPAWDLYPLWPKPEAFAGAGRRVELSEPVPITTLVERVKQHLGLSALRLATSPSHANGTPIFSVAVCAGSGGSLFEGVDAELYLTGEMRHHDVLDKLSRGSSVMLCEHTHTERGFLPSFRGRLLELLPGLDVRISGTDSEPLTLA